MNLNEIVAPRAKAYDRIDKGFRGFRIGDIRIDDFMKMIVDFIMGDYEKKNEINEVLDKFYQMAQSKIDRKYDIEFGGAKKGLSTILWSLNGTTEI